MSAPRFYHHQPLIFNDILELPPEAAHHAIRVLRLRVNEPVQVFDGEGSAFDAAIIEISGKRVVLGNLKPCTPERQPSMHIVLAHSMCSSEKMDWVVQKATELGAAEFQPVQTQRSVARLSSERAEKRTEHWHSVTISACEQCGRNTLPQTHAPQEMSVWLAQMRGDTGAKFILHPEGSTTLKQQPQPQGKVTLLIGPEGGFSADEVLMAHQVGFVPVLLGPRVLRTETAALAGITALQTLWGDFS
jgi:16S rRNA (uracil1498-N3)-methyltransferase